MCSRGREGYTFHTHGTDCDKVADNVSDTLHRRTLSQRTSRSSHTYKIHSALRLDVSTPVTGGQPDEYEAMLMMTIAAEEMMGRFMGPSKHAWSSTAVSTIATDSARFFEIESM